MKTEQDSPPEGAVGGQTSLGGLDNVLGFRVRRLQNLLARGFGKLAGTLEARPGIYSVLELISGNPGLSQISLAREVAFDKATMVALIDDIERLGWARRERDPQDRRRHSLQITREGEIAVTELRHMAHENEAAVNAGLTAEERAELFRLLDKAYFACSSDLK